jgi:hypothetical protein
MKSLPWCLAGLLFCSVIAASVRASTLEERVNLEARGISLRAALRLLTKGTPTTVRVDPQVPDAEVRLTLKGVTIDLALRLIVRQASRQAPTLAYEASPEGFRVFLDSTAPDVPTQEDPNKFTVTRSVPPPDAPAEPAAAPAPDPDPNSGPSQDPPRIDPTPPRFRLTIDPGTPNYSFYRPPGSPVYNDKMPLGGYGKLAKTWGASAYTWLGPPLNITDWRPAGMAPLRIEPIREYYHPLPPGRRRAPPKNNDGGNGGSNGNGYGGNGSGNGNSSGPGGFGRRPL